MNVGAYEAKTHLSSLLEKVVQGEHITITKHSIPIAMLVPPNEEIKSNPSEVIKQIRAFRKHCFLKGDSIKKMKSEGRK